MTVENRRSLVIGISSPSGGGKSTVARYLAEQLPDAAMLSFDEYDEVTIHPASYQNWLAEGADYNAWQASHLAADLARLKRGQAISTPTGGRVVSPAAYIVFDAPLGRAHQATGNQIDFMVYLDTPLDVAMARRLLRDTATTAAQLPWDELRATLAAYLAFGRRAYLEMDRQIKPNCDLILDGMLPPAELASRIVDSIHLAREIA